MKTIIIGATLLILSHPSVTVYQKPAYHDNAYYCQAWKAGEQVIGANYKQMQEICHGTK